MKKLFSLLLISSFAYGQELRLICDGVITETETDVIYGTTKEPTGATKLNTTFYDKESKKTQATIFLDLNLDDETGTLEVPETMRRKNAKILKTKLDKLAVTDKKISGRAKFNAFSVHKFNIDRRTGDINYSWLIDSTFNGSCRKNDIVENKF